MIASTQTNHPLTGPKSATDQQAALDFATARLKSAGLRITQPRLAILEALSNRPQPTSIEQIHEIVGYRLLRDIVVHAAQLAADGTCVVCRSITTPAAHNAVASGAAAAESQS